jgi:hypothetical protein
LLLLHEELLWLAVARYTLFGGIARGFRILREIVWEAADQEPCGTKTKDGRHPEIPGAPAEESVGRIYTSLGGIMIDPIRAKHTKVMKKLVKQMAELKELSDKYESDLAGGGGQMTHMMELRKADILRRCKAFSKEHKANDAEYNQACKARRAAYKLELIAEKAMVEARRAALKDDPGKAASK